MIAAITGVTFNNSTVPPGLAAIPPAPGVKTPGYCRVVPLGQRRREQSNPPGRLKLISTNIVRRIRCGVFSTMPGILPETSSGDGVPFVP
jgi:hypothetical protein